MASLASFRSFITERRPLVVAAILASVVVSFTAQAENGVGIEDQVKAGYLYNFARFVEWPSSTGQSGPMTVGVVGDPGTAHAIWQSLHKQTLNGRGFIIREVPTSDGTEGSQILFIPKSGVSDPREILLKVRGTPVLTVGETSEFISAGGMIALLARNNKIHFAVNMPAIEKAGLKVSSQMLQYAQVVDRQ